MVQIHCSLPEGKAADLESRLDFRERPVFYQDSSRLEKIEVNSNLLQGLCDLIRQLQAAGLDFFYAGLAEWLCSSLPS